METLRKPSLFWDVAHVDPKSNQKFIIERILDLGDEKDFKWALDYYGRDKIVENLVKSKRLSQKSLLFWCRYFKINIQRCLGKQSTKKQSAFWNR
jgi:hypothetical protein